MNVLKVETEAEARVMSSRELCHPDIYVIRESCSSLREVALCQNRDVLKPGHVRGYTLEPTLWHRTAGEKAAELGKKTCAGRSIALWALE